jgi:hypothetical protein
MTQAVDRSRPDAAQTVVTTPRVDAASSPSPETPAATARPQAPASRVVARTGDGAPPRAALATEPTATRAERTSLPPATPAPRSAPGNEVHRETTSRVEGTVVPMRESVETARHPTAAHVRRRDAGGDRPAGATPSAAARDVVATGEPLPHAPTARHIRDDSSPSEEPVEQTVAIEAAPFVAGREPAQRGADAPGAPAASSATSPAVDRQVESTREASHVTPADPTAPPVPVRATSDRAARATDVQRTSQTTPVVTARNVTEARETSDPEAAPTTLQPSTPRTLAPEKHEPPGSRAFPDTPEPGVPRDFPSPEGAAAELPAEGAVEPREHAHGSAPDIAAGGLPVLPLRQPAAPTLQRAAVPTMPPSPATPPAVAARSVEVPRGTRSPHVPSTRDVREVNVDTPEPASPTMHRETAPERASTSRPPSSSTVAPRRSTTPPVRETAVLARSPAAPAVLSRTVSAPRAGEARAPLPPARQPDEASAAAQPPAVALTPSPLARRPGLDIHAALADARITPGPAATAVVPVGRVSDPPAVSAALAAHPARLPGLDVRGAYAPSSSHGAPRLAASPTPADEPLTAPPPPHGLAVVPPLASPTHASPLPASAPAASPPPAVQRVVTAGAGPTEVGPERRSEAPGDELEELADRLYDHIRARFRTELLIGRERAGLLADRY